MTESMASLYGAPLIPTIPAPRPEAPDLFMPTLTLCPVCSRHVSSFPCPFCTAKRGEGAKDDAGKPRRSLVPMRAFAHVIAVLTDGAKRYAPWNWVKVPGARERYYDALHRHVDAWWAGEALDPLTGEPHLAHAICCLLFLLALDIGDTGPREEISSDVKQEE